MKLLMQYCAVHSNENFKVIATFQYKRQRGSNEHILDSESKEYYPRYQVF